MAKVIISQARIDNNHLRGIHQETINGFDIKWLPYKYGAFGFWQKALVTHARSDSYEVLPESEDEICCTTILKEHTLAALAKLGASNV